MSIPIYNCSLHRDKEISDFVSRAELVGYFSVDDDRTYLADSSKMMYYKPPPADEGVPFDLDSGHEIAKCRDESFIEEGMVHVLEWIKLNHTKIEPTTPSDKWIQPDFVCSRGVLTRLFRTRDAIEDEWIIYAAKWRGTIYMRADKKIKIKYMRSKTDLRMSSGGLKFEQYLITDSPDKSPESSEAVVGTNEFRCVYKRRFGKHTVLYASETDGVLSETKLEDPLPMKDLKFVELKTNKMIQHGRHERTLRRFKFSKWWCQAFLSNVDKVVCGFRDDNGIVYELREYRVAELATMPDSWDPKACADFCASLLERISKSVINDCDETIYKFERLKRANSIYVTHLPASSEHEFIPKSYRDATE